MNAQLQEIADRIDTTVDELLAFFDSPSGRRLRKYLATGPDPLRSAGDADAMAQAHADRQV